MIDGTNSSDVLNGTPGNDEINGLGGSDTLNGGAGNDDINGGAGNDALNGDEDDDNLDGGTGRDTLDGGTGRDNLTGGGGSDTFIIDAEGLVGDEDTVLDFTTSDTISIVGTLDRDISVTQVGNDVQIAADGVLIGTVVNASLADVLGSITYDGEQQPLLTGVENFTGTNADETIDGTSGIDAIYGLGGSDTIDALDGDDDVFGGFGNDVINGGEGFDYLEGEGGRDTINGGDDDDSILGGAANDTLNGDDGDDFIEGGEGNDTVTGGAGADIFSIDTNLAGSSVDTITDFNSRDGDSIALANTDGKTITFTQAGDDVEIAVDGTVMGIVQTADAGDVQNATTFDGFDAPPASEVNEIRGTFAGETLDGTNGIDLIFGFGGSDTINGLDSDDQIFGGFGGDTINGGEGNDIINGEGGSDSLNGGEDDDIVNGGNGNDGVFGGSGNDELNGGSGNDLLSGDEGNDTLTGGDGSDTYTGGTGADTFQLAVNDSGRDTITDFNASEGDQIAFIGSVAGSDLFFVFDGTDVTVTDNGLQIAVIQNTTLDDIADALSFEGKPDSINFVDNSPQEEEEEESPFPEGFDAASSEGAGNPWMAVMDMDIVM